MFTTISIEKLREVRDELRHLSETLPMPVSGKCKAAYIALAVAIDELNKYERGE
jgi:hypothetical protein